MKPVMDTTRAHFIKTRMGDVPDWLKQQLCFSDSLAELMESEKQIRQRMAKHQAEGGHHDSGHQGVADAVKQIGMDEKYARLRKQRR